jgi:hypothetical protein
MANQPAYGADPDPLTYLPGMSKPPKTFHTFFVRFGSPVIGQFSHPALLNKSLEKEAVGMHNMTILTTS